MDNVFVRYPRAVVHLRRQFENKRFGLIFGSGLSSHFKVPNWEALIERIANDPAVDGKAIHNGADGDKSLPYMTEMLFQHYRRQRYDAAPPNPWDARAFDFTIARDWVQIVRAHLYADAKTMPADIAHACKSHPYLSVYLSLIRKIRMTVTYNFDDFIEQAIANDPQRGEDEKKASRGYETVTNMSMQFRRSNAIIYHPNGVIPLLPEETPSDRFVFSESSYAERMIGIFVGEYGGLVSHLAHNTCLIIGVSLTDETFRNVLSQNAKANPGNYHYYVLYNDGQTKISDKQLDAITLTNFNVYNLITLYLNDNEIASLGKLIQCGPAAIHDCKQRSGGPHLAFRYYLTGSIGAGKSTCLNYLRNCEAYDEWLEPRIPVLARAWDSLNDEEKNEADTWIIKQFKLKNDILRGNKEGIFVLDRGPLDPLAFTKREEWSAKANKLLDMICDVGRKLEVEPGHVILLMGDPEELAVRILLSGRKEYTPKRLKKMQANLLEGYWGKGMTVIDTRGLSVTDVVRKISEIIHLVEYVPSVLHDKLLDYEKEKIG